MNKRAGRGLRRAHTCDDLVVRVCTLSCQERERKSVSISSQAPGLNEIKGTNVAIYRSLSANSYSLASNCNGMLKIVVIMWPLEHNTGKNYHAPDLIEVTKRYTLHHGTQRIGLFSV